MKASGALQKFANAAVERESFLVERAKLEFSVSLERHRRTAKLNYADIAKRLGTSAAYVTKVFRGDSNLTIESMVKLSRAVGADLVVGVTDGRRDAKVWAWAGQVAPALPANHSLFRTETTRTPTRTDIPESTVKVPRVA